MRLKSFLSAIQFIGIIFFFFSCSNRQVRQFDLEPALDYCVEQATKAISTMPEDSVIPRNIGPGQSNWNFVKYEDWTSGFWPGTLWYVYEHTRDEKWKQAAQRYSEYLIPLSQKAATDHDLGFQVFNSLGHGYLLTDNEDYKQIVLRTADTLATLFNPKVGTILSWPRPVPNMEWPQHNTIMDNMINLELLFWASKNGGNKRLGEIAVSHAETTMKHHFRPDYTSYHVVVYDRETGEKIKGVTHQGYADDSMWARGQAWAIYGYTMVYRETKDPKFLDFAHKITQAYLDRLPEDFIPYWDFNAPNIPNEPRDASAAAIVASALLELSTLTKDEKLANRYRTESINMLTELSANYQSGKRNPSFLLHSTGHYPNGSEVDYSIIYADYYYIEALVRLKRLEKGIEVLEAATVTN